jgi:pimeloyl-ACP methyl ester carboxylesterase
MKKISKFTTIIFLILLNSNLFAQQKKTYVFVHGAWGGGWAWKKVGKIISEQGNDVYRATLTGLGERKHLSSPNINLSTHIEDVVNLIIFEDLKEVILVGHSYGGMVATGVLDRIPDRIKQVIYIDGHLPFDGESVFDAMNKERVPSVMAMEKEGFLIPSWTKAEQPFPKDVPHPAACLKEKIVLKNTATKSFSGKYILTADDATKPEADNFYKSFLRAKSYGYQTLIMQADHNPQNSKPEELSKLLLD